MAPETALRQLIQGLLEGDTIIRTLAQGVFYERADSDAPRPYATHAQQGPVLDLNTMRTTNGWRVKWLVRYHAQDAEGVDPLEPIDEMAAAGYALFHARDDDAAGITAEAVLANLNTAMEPAGYKFSNAERLQGGGPYPDVIGDTEAWCRADLYEFWLKPL